MKKFTTLVMLLLFCSGLHAQIFVKADAGGANNGSSWADAFTDLQEAIAAAQPGDAIWVAAGTYLPGTADSSTFLITKDIQLYGGFAGTESSLLERNWQAHPTVLSGDVNGDDVEEDFELNRSDNVTNLVFIDIQVTEGILDGFTISNGHADGNAIQPVVSDSLGGGIFVEGQVQIRNCHFTQNYASFGGGISFFEAGTEGSLVTNCTFERNRTKLRGAGIAALYLPGQGVTVDSCLFLRNQADDAGGAVYLFDASCNIVNSSFNENRSDRTGGAVYLLNFYITDLEVSATNCIFEKNSSTHGGAFFYLTGSGGNNNLRFTSCEFINNQAITSLIHNYPDGGALGFQASYDNTSKDSIILENCTLLNNTAERHGGSIAYFNSAWRNSYFAINNCHFLENSGTIWGGGIFYSARGGTGNKFAIHASQFTSNTAGLVGGAIALRNRATNNEVEIIGCQIDSNAAERGGGINSVVLGGIFYSETVANCTLTNNTASRGGGYLIQNNTLFTSLNIQDCFIEDNLAIQGGGGMEIGGYDNSTIEAIVSETVIAGNESGNRGAGGSFHFNNNSRGQITLENCNVVGNINESGGSSQEGGGGVTLINNGQGRTKMYIRSSIIEENVGDVTGGILIRNNRSALSQSKDSVFIQNSLIANNAGYSTAGGISVNAVAELILQESTVAENIGEGLLLQNKVNAHLRNSIFYNPGYNNYMGTNTDTSTVTATSYGGVLSSDNTLNQALGTAVISNAHPLFLGTGGHPYQLSSGSPAVDAAVAITGPPMYDVAGNERMQGSAMDIGAYESSFTVAVKERKRPTTQLTIFPNPATTEVSIQLSERLAIESFVQIFDATGKVVLEQAVGQLQPLFQLPTGQLPAGKYEVVVQSGKKVAVGSFLKL